MALFELLLQLTAEGRLPSSSLPRFDHTRKYSRSATSCQHDELERTNAALI